MLVAIPSEAPGGLDAEISSHFGHCPVFTLVKLNEDNLPTDISVLDNKHEEGQCLAPVALLKDAGVDTVIAGGMGARPFAGFRDAGIEVQFKGEATTVAGAVEQLAKGGCAEFCDDQTCGGGSGGCGHGHEPVQIERAPLEGEAIIQADRIVALSFILTDGDDNVVEASTAEQPLVYLHGHNQMLEGLEKGVEGLTIGDEKEVTLEPKDAFGDPDPEAIFDVPRAQFGPEVEPGLTVQARTPQGVIPLRVIEVGEEQVKVDANHPLAGKTIVFHVKVLGLGMPTERELEAGGAMGPP